MTIKVNRGCGHKIDNQLGVRSQIVIIVKVIIENKKRNSYPNHKYGHNQRVMKTI